MMSPTTLYRFFFFTMLVAILNFNTGCHNNHYKTNIPSTANEKDGYDGPELLAEMEFRHTKDPALNRVPRERLVAALNKTNDSKIYAQNVLSSYGAWTERGPNSDATGPSNGNTRANSGITSGRIRAIFVDAADGTGNTVWIGGVCGGIWKTTDITASPATWTLVNDFFSNMAITSICQDPTNTNIMYFCTGESFYNFEAVRGDGVFKSTDHGVTWAQLASTTGTNFDYCSKILCDASGNIYLSTRSGIFRSTVAEGGSNWTSITPTGVSSSISDMELSNTGRLHISAGMLTTCDYRYTDIPSTVAVGTWTSPTSGYPASSIRIELGCSGNTLYALPSNGTYQVPTIYKSTDGGANWSATTAQPTSGWASGQAWYSLAVDIDPANSNNAIVGGLEPYKTTNGGTSWTKIANWVGTTGQYVHADIHFIKMYGTNRVLFGCDGGIHYSSDGGTTIRDRNSGLRLKQFFSCAIHPSTTDYFLAGAQDNGTHQFSTAGLGATVEVMGGDGAFVHIDQNQPQYQFCSYVYNQYRRSTNSGATWTAIDFSASIGQFINPTDYDDAANIMYGAYSAGSYIRWTNPQTGSTAASVAITALNGNKISAVTVSPYTSNRVYFGTDPLPGGTGLCYVDNANTIASGSAGTSISTGLPTNTNVSCIAIGSSDNNLMVSFSNYGIQNVWVSSNGGTSWTAIDGNLPDMPVRWCMFDPLDNTKAIIATETGVWLTQLINGGSTVWLASPSFPTVRTDMLQYRSSDKLIVAATHGRGLWSQNLFSILPVNNFILRGRWNNGGTELNWNFEDSKSGDAFTVESSVDGIHFSAAGIVNASVGKTNYTLTDLPAASTVFYRVKLVSNTGKILFSNVIKLSKSGSDAGYFITQLFPNPVQTELKVAFSNAAKGPTRFSIVDMSGREIWNREEELKYIGANIRSWNLTGLRAGIYIFSISNEKQKVAQAFIKL